jgi:hypothetical protein
LRSGFAFGALRARVPALPIVRRDFLPSPALRVVPLRCGLAVRSVLARCALVLGEVVDLPLRAVALFGLRALALLVLRLAFFGFRALVLFPFRAVALFLPRAVVFFPLPEDPFSLRTDPPRRGFAFEVAFAFVEAGRWRLWPFRRVFAAFAISAT